MPKTVRKKQPITLSSASASSTVRPSSLPFNKSAAGTSSLATRTLIRRFHVLLKRQAQLKQKLSPATLQEVASIERRPSLAALKKELGEVEKEMVDSGGLEWYQRASELGQSKDRGGDSSHVLVDWLKSLNANVGRSAKTPLRVLEIGALVPDNYRLYPWIVNTPLDLHSRHPQILEQDFMDRPDPKESGEALYDIVSCSLVLNFVPSPEGRGKMLEHIKAFLPDPSTSSSAPSYLFFVLPTPCVVNSRYTSEDHWRGLMLAVGFEQVKERLNKKGKGVAYWLYKRVEPKGEKPVFGKKTILDPSAGRNNFAVVL